MGCLIRRLSSYWISYRNFLYEVPNFVVQAQEHAKLEITVSKQVNWFDILYRIDSHPT